MADSAWITGQFQGEFIGTTVKGRRPDGQRAYALTLTQGTIRDARRAPSLPQPSVDDKRKWLVQAELADAVFLAPGEPGTAESLGRCKLWDVHLGQWTVDQTGEGKGFCSGRISGRIYAQVEPAPVTAPPVRGRPTPEEEGADPEEGDLEEGELVEGEARETRFSPPAALAALRSSGWLDHLWPVVGLGCLAWLLLWLLGRPFVLFWLAVLLVALLARGWHLSPPRWRRLGCLPSLLLGLLGVWLFLHLGGLAALLGFGLLVPFLALAFLGWLIYRVALATGVAAFVLLGVGLAVAGILWHLPSDAPPEAVRTAATGPVVATPLPQLLPSAMQGVVPLEQAVQDPSSFFDHPGQRLLLDNELLFPFESAQLGPEAITSLHKLARLLRSHPNARIVLEGHTDTIGTPEANRHLSAMRAEAVKDCLVRRLRIDPDQLTVIGAGSSKPLVGSGDAQAQSLNRRVEVRVAD